MLYFDKIFLYGVLILLFGSGVVVVVLVYFLVNLYLRKKILREVYGGKDERERILFGFLFNGVLFIKLLIFFEY